MKGMKIGAVAQLAGIAPSAIRYYEKVGLLPQPARQSGRRCYRTDAVGRLRIIRIAREAGFSIAETKLFLSGFSATTPPAARWRSLAERKLAQFDTLIKGIERMRVVLKSSFHCRCLRIEDCERAVLEVRATNRPNSRADFF